MKYEYLPRQPARNSQPRIRLRKAPKEEKKPPTPEKKKKRFSSDQGIRVCENRGQEIQSTTRRIAASAPISPDEAETALKRPDRHLLSRYTKDDVASDAEPSVKLTFSFNGGTGSASCGCIWLCAAQRRVTDGAMPEPLLPPRI